MARSKKVWLEYLNSDVFDRLCSCRTIRADLQELVNAKWRAYKEVGKAAQGFTKEDALVAVLELLDCNSRYFDLSTDEYNDLCKGD